MCDEQTSYWNGARDCALSILIELEKGRAPTKSKEAARRAWISAATIGSEKFREEAARAGPASQGLRDARSGLRPLHPRRR